LNYALLCSCEAKPKQKSFPPPLIPLPYDTFFRRGSLLPSRNERSEVKGGDTALLTQSVANLNLYFPDTGLGESNFVNLSTKRVKAKYFFFRRGGNEPSEGAYTKYVTKLRRNFQRCIKEKDKP